MNKEDLEHFIAAIREAEQDIQEGRTQPAEVVFEELKAKHGLGKMSVEQDKDATMPPELTEYVIEGSGSVSLRYFATDSAKPAHGEILVVRYIGEYPAGSAGNFDARCMYAMAMAAIANFEPQGVIHDLTDFRYEWGDMLELVFDAVPSIPIDYKYETSPVAIVVGPDSEEAVRTLLLGIDSDEPLENEGSVFRDLTAAWHYVSDKLTDDKVLIRKFITLNESEQREATIRRAYAAFNARDIDAALTLMQADVAWPASTEGSGYVHGHDEICAYWTRQWGMIDPHVDPIGMTAGADGRVVVEVHQVVRDLDGALLMDVMLQHVYRFEGGLIAHMEIIA